MLRTLSFIGTHPLARKRRMAAFGRFVFWQIRSRFTSEIEYNWIGGTKLLARNGMTGATGNIYCGLHEFADMALVLHLMKAGELFVDVGANVGSYTILASAIANAETIAVEPDPDTIQDLRKNVTINKLDDRVRMVEAALGAHSGVGRFTIGLDTINRFASDVDLNTRQVSVLRMDDLLRDERPVLIKLDVEGHEATVLSGSIESLRSPSLLAVETECSSAEVTEILVSAGFFRAYYDPFSRSFSRTPVITSANALFIRNESECERRVQMAPRTIVFGQEF